MRLNRLKLVFACLLLSIFIKAQIFPPNLKRVLFIGDSITYTGIYVQIVEAYQRVKFPQQEIEIFNLGVLSLKKPTKHLLLSLVI